jgi:hypothetical protein
MSAGNSGNGGSERRGQDGYQFLGDRASPMGGGQQLGDKRAAAKGVTDNVGMGAGGLAWDSSAAAAMGRNNTRPYPPSKTRP